MQPAQRFAYELRYRSRAGRMMHLDADLLERRKLFFAPFSSARLGPKDYSGSLRV